MNAVAPQLIDTPEAIAQVIAFVAGDASAPVSGAIPPSYGA